MNRFIKIGEASKILGVTIQTLRLFQPACMAGEEEINNGARSTLSGDTSSILESAKSDSCDRNILIVIGETPIRESSLKLLE